MKQYQVFKLNYNHISSGFTLNKIFDADLNTSCIFSTREEAESWIKSKQPIHYSYTIMEMYHPEYD